MSHADGRVRVDDDTFKQVRVDRDTCKYVHAIKRATGRTIPHIMMTAVQPEWRAFKGSQATLPPIEDPPSVAADHAAVLRSEGHG